MKEEEEKGEGGGGKQGEKRWRWQHEGEVINGGGGIVLFFLAIKSFSNSGRDRTPRTEIFHTVSNRYLHRLLKELLLARVSDLVPDPVRSGVFGFI